MLKQCSVCSRRSTSQPRNHHSHKHFQCTTFWVNDTCHRATTHRVELRRVRGREQQSRSSGTNCGLEVSVVVDTSVVQDQRVARAQMLTLRTQSQPAGGCCVDLLKCARIMCESCVRRAMGGSWVGRSLPAPSVRSPPDGLRSRSPCTPCTPPPPPRRAPTGARWCSSCEERTSLKLYASPSAHIPSAEYQSAHPSTNTRTLGQPRQLSPDSTAVCMGAALT